MSESAGKPARPVEAPPGWLADMLEPGDVESSFLVEATGATCTVPPALAAGAKDVGEGVIVTVNPLSSRRLSAPTNIAMSSTSPSTGPPLWRAALRRCLCCSSGAAMVETAVGASWLMAVLGRVPSGSREGPQGSEHVKIFVSCTS